MNRVSFAVSTACAVLCARHAALAGTGETATPAPAAVAETPAPTASPLPYTELQLGRKHKHGIDKRLQLPVARRVELKMQVLDGPDLALSHYEGRVVFLNVFATWCEPCRSEQPEFTAFAQLHADDTTVVGIDAGDEDDAVRAYRKLFHIPYPIAMDRSNSVVPRLYSGQISYPATIVVRPNGTISCAWCDTVDAAWLENERLIALM
jgi:thiol-disulfide isomerase/thioredoxin